MKIINAVTGHLFIDKLELRPGQSLCVAGANRSGIMDLFLLISGQKSDLQAQCLNLPNQPGVISFKRQQDIYEAELKKDDTDFIDKIDPGTPARDFLYDIQTHSKIIDALEMCHCLDTGYRQLSTGQSRKLVLLSHITKGSNCLVILAPYDGLDVQSRKELDKALFHLHSKHIQLILFVHNTVDIPRWCSFAAMVSKGKLIHFGPPENVIPAIADELKSASADFQAQASDFTAEGMSPLTSEKKEVLVDLKNATAGYHGKIIFSGVTLKMHRGDHTLVTGPNGSGKSTLLHIITGDHPACYQNDLTVMGFVRGNGESIWDIKRQMGIVSTDLHRNYRVPGTARACILSGLFDSIGLYQSVSRHEEKRAEQWLERLGMGTLGETPFRDLTYANQRLVLIARALIKGPKLLILDEPTQGLDEANRNAVLDFLEAVARMDACTILYVSHREDEFRSFFVQQLSISGMTNA